MMFVKEFIVRLQDGKNRTIFFWENVEGALTDKTNAFGCFLAGLLGLEEPRGSRGFNNRGKCSVYDG